MSSYLRDTTLAYAFAPKIAEAIEHQVFRYLVHDHIFYHVPVIATTAEMFRLNDEVTIEQIRSATSIEDIAKREPCLVMNYSSGIELQHYNAKVFASLRKRVGDSGLHKSLNSFTKDLDHLFSVIATYYAPRAVVFVCVDVNQAGFEKLFGYIDELLRPSKDLLAEIEAQEREIKKRLEDFKKRRRPRKKIK